MPSSTVARSPVRAMRRKLKGSRVSRLTLMRRTPAFRIVAALRVSNCPLVVSDTSASGSRIIAGSSTSNLGESSGSPPVMRTLSMPAASITNSAAYSSSSASSSCRAACRRLPSGTQ